VDNAVCYFFFNFVKFIPRVDSHLTESKPFEDTENGHGRKRNSFREVAP